MALLCANAPPQALHELSHPLCKLTLCLHWYLRPQPWQSTRPGLPNSDRGLARRPFRDPHSWRRAQHGRDSPRAGACAPKCAADDSQLKAPHRRTSLL